MEKARATCSSAPPNGPALMEVRRSSARRRTYSPVASRPDARPRGGSVQSSAAMRRAMVWLKSRLIVLIDVSPPRYRRPVSAWELRGQPPFVREAMSPTFGAIFRARRPGETPAVLHAQAGALREALRESGAILLRGFG